MKKTKIEKLYTIESKLYNRYDNKKYQLTKPRIHKIQIEILIAQSDELFFIEVEAVLNDKSKSWCGELETQYWFAILGEARDGDKDCLQLLRDEFKPNPAFKKETARFANV